ncbi:TonB-dependent receptor plug domain-containing protein [candidate division KSB1 bacterium]|nr:TonB-dependent receptor plug domain-containing protein [candidate division KSB1 bacterium]
MNSTYMAYRIVLLYLVLSLSCAIVFAQTTGRITGQLYDLDSNKPLSGVLVKIQKTNQVASSDRNGKFVFTGIPGGDYLLECICHTYPRILTRIVLPAGADTTVTIRMAQNNAALDVFEIGGIQVEADRDLMPRDYAATTRISSGEVENLQASSLGDVLEMIPGLEKSNRLGLDKAIHANVRGSASDHLGTFGTKIILDETPFSNNANMQMSAGGTITTSAGSGIDLRLIPADNIESVEIIRGVPSAKYGDLTSGIIKVKTKSGVSSPRLKVKSNPNTTEANFGTGFKVGINTLNINLNYGFSERELRKDGDEFHRINATLIAKRPFLDGKFPLNWKLFATRLLDEEKPTDIRRTSAYNRGYTINTDLWGDHTPNNIEKYRGNIYFHYSRKNTFRSRLVEADPRAYIGELRMIGDEVNLGGRLEANRKLIFASAVHELMAGVEVQYDNNFGEGMIIDSTKNYYAQDSPKRSYSFDDVPGMTQVALYAEDKYTGKLWKEFTMVLGVRYDLYKPKKINFSGLWDASDFIESQHGSFVSPRIGWMLYLTSSTQLRGGYGTSAKIPSMDYIFKPRESDLHKLQYYSYDQSNFDLKGYLIKELKLGIDQKLFNWASLSIEGYLSWRNDEPRQQSYPFFYEVNPDTFWVPTYSIYENIGWKDQQGFEATFATRSYKGVSLKINGTYRYTLTGKSTLSYTSNPDPIDTDGDGVTDSRDPAWRDIKDSWTKKWIVDYQLEYRARQLGLWMQFIAQQIPVYQTKSNNPYEKGIFANYLNDYPNNWVFNFRLSKSLWWDSEVSLYVNNFLDDRGIYEVPWMRQYYPETNSWGRKVYSSRNNPVFWGFEFSTRFDFSQKPKKR